ncbi:MAG: SLBB domain-containing protein, partial [Chthoniobacterales bacterium]
NSRNMPMTILEKARPANTADQWQWNAGFNIVMGFLLGGAALAVAIFASYFTETHDGGGSFIKKRLVGVIITLVVIVLIPLLGLFYIYLSRAAPYANTQLKINEKSEKPGPASRTPLSTNNTAESYQGRVSIGGAVKSPGYIPYSQDLTLIAAIDAAGGLSQFANRKKITLMRSGKAMNVDLTALLTKESYNSNDNPPLQPGDIIEVSGSTW